MEYIVRLGINANPSLSVPLMKNICQAYFKKQNKNHQDNSDNIYLFVQIKNNYLSID